MNVDCIGNGLSYARFRLRCIRYWHGSMGSPPPQTPYERPSRYTTPIGRKNKAKFENYRVSRNGHKIKSTQPNSMILVSFSSAEDALFNDVKNDTFSSRVLKISRSAFLGTPGRWPSNCHRQPVTWRRAWLLMYRVSGGNKQVGHLKKKKKNQKYFQSIILGTEIIFYQFGACSRMFVFLTCVNTFW